MREGVWPGMEWVADYPVLWLAALVAAALVAGFVLRGVGVKNRREYGWALGAVSGGLIVLYACFVIEYALSPAFSDHVEPQIAAVSCLFMRGKALYPAPTAAEQYALPYGPYTYLWTAGYCWLMGPSILAVKASTAVSALAGVGFLLAACWRVAGRWAGLACTALATVVFLAFRAGSFWCRPDSHQLFLMSLNVFALTLSNPWWAALVLGAAAGIDVNMKINAAAYTIPIATAFYLRHRKWRPLILAGVVAAAVAIAPFSLPEISLQNYQEWMRLASRHPFAGELPASLVFAGWLAGLCLLGSLPSIWSGQSDDSRRRDWWMTAARWAPRSW